jgi:hypothetical protein
MGANKEGDATLSPSVVSQFQCKSTLFLSSKKFAGIILKIQDQCVFSGIHQSENL